MTGIGDFSDKALEAFKRDGFLVVRGLYSGKEIDEASRWIDELTAREPQKGREMVYYEPASGVCSLITV